MKNCFIALSVLLYASSAAVAAEIRISASDLISESITPSLNAFAEERGIELTVDGIGSLPALERLRSNEVDLAIIAVPENDTVPREEFSVFSFAYDAAVVVVNSGNPIEEISVGGLGGVYGANEELNFNTWGDFGLPGWGNRNIKPVAGVGSDSIALELFRYAVLAGAMKTNVSIIEPEEVDAMLSSETASIAILSSVPESSNAKVLMISETKDAPSFGPTEENIHYGDYPIRLPFYFVYHQRDEEKLGLLLRYMLEDSVAEDLRESGFFPLPETVRRQKAIDFDMQGLK